MKTRRVRFSVKFLLVMTTVVAVLAASWVKYGSKHFALKSLNENEKKNGGRGVAGKALDQPF